MFPLLQPAQPCPGCGAGDGQRPLHVYRNKARRTTDEDELALLGCERCGFAYSHPRPTDAQLEAYYSGSDGWEAREGGDDFAAGAALQDKLAVKREKYARERDLLAPLLPPAGTPRRTLDFGAGQGAWLDVLADDGWETWGIEPGPAQRELAARRHRMVDELPAGEHFDLVVVNHVLEHLRDPLAVLRALAGALTPEGRLFVSVPDLGRLGEHGRLKYVASDVHISSFTFEGMRSLLGLAGLRVVAHLGGEEWDELHPSERARLKVLAERGGPAEAPPPRPLDVAIAALRLHERRDAEATEVPVAFPLLVPWADCPVCGAGALRVLHAYKPRRRPLGRSGLALLGCSACGVVHSHPAPPVAAPADGPPADPATVDLAPGLDPVGRLRDVAAALAPEGRVVIRAPALVHQRRPAFADSDAGHLYFTEAGLRSLLALGGLAVEEVVAAGDPLTVRARRGQAAVQQDPLRPAIDALLSLAHRGEQPQAASRDTGVRGLVRGALRRVGVQRASTSSAND